MRAISLICVLAFIINIVFLSCQNNAQGVPTFKTKEELAYWIKTKVIKTIEILPPLRIFYINQQA